MDLTSNTRYFLKPGGVEGKTDFGTIINEIQPLPGCYGFGVAVNDIEAAKIGLKPMPGHKNQKGKNFGNYTDENGSIFVCIPRFYYKINSNKIPEADNQNEIEYSLEPKEGFLTPLAFKTLDGSYLDCVFVGKYITSLEGRTFVSKPMTIPCVYKNEYQEKLYSISNVYSELTEIYYDTYGGTGIPLNLIQKEVNKQNIHQSIHYNLLRFVYILTAMIHVQHCFKYYGDKTPSDLCGYADKSPYYPRGANKLGKFVPTPEGGYLYFDLADSKDSSFGFGKLIKQGVWEIAYVHYSGSSLNLTKTAHNGQLCGIQDLNGNVWEKDMGVYRISNILCYSKGINFDNESFDNIKRFDNYNYKKLDYLCDIDDTTNPIGYENGGERKGEMFNLSEEDNNMLLSKSSDLTKPDRLGIHAGDELKFDKGFYSVTQNISKTDTTFDYLLDPTAIPPKRGTTIIPVEVDFKGINYGGRVMSEYHGSIWTTHITTRHGILLAENTTSFRLMRHSAPIKQI